MKITILIVIIIIIKLFATERTIMRTREVAIKTTLIELIIMT